MNYIDTEALVRSLAVGLVIGLIIAGIYTMAGKKARQSFFPITISFTLLAAFILYFIWPSSVEVPDLNGLSKAEAIEILEKNKLTAKVDSQITMRAKPGVVIQDSQEPIAGERVSAKTSVKFVVGAMSENYVQFVSPLSDTQVKCEVLPSNIGRVYVSATIRIAPTQMPLLWIRGVDPATPEWYIQKYPFGLSKSPEKDFWFGHAQIGNPEYPPLDGNVFDFAITIIDKAESNKLMTDPGEFASPNPIGHSITIAKNVTMKTEQK